MVDPAKLVYKGTAWGVKKIAGFAGDIIPGTNKVVKSVVNADDNNIVTNGIDSAGERLEGELSEVGDAIRNTGENIEGTANNVAKKVLGVPEDHKTDGTEFKPETFGDITSKELPNGKSIKDIPVVGDIVKATENAPDNFILTEIDRKANKQKEAEKSENSVPTMSSEEKQETPRTMENQRTVHESQVKFVGENAKKVPENTQIDARVAVHEDEKQLQKVDKNPQTISLGIINQNQGASLGD